MSKLDDIDDMCEESFEDMWDGDAWQREAHYSTFKEGFAAGCAYMMSKLGPYLKEIKAASDELRSIRDRQG